MLVGVNVNDLWLNEAAMVLNFHKHQLRVLIWYGIRMFLWRSQCLCGGYFKICYLLKIIWLGALLFWLKITFV